MGLTIKLSHKLGWYDGVDDRKIHSGNIPRIGGVGIFSAFLVSSVAFFYIMKFSSYEGNVSLQFLNEILILSVIIFLVGLIDDFRNLKARYKFIVQIVVSLVVVFSGNYFTEFYIPIIRVTIENVPFGMFITVLWIIGITNAINLIDGMDGLSSGIVLIPLLTMAITLWVYGDVVGAGILLILSASIIGFMFFNFPPAKIFMGDGGSLFLGFILSVVPLRFLQYHELTNAVPVLSISLVFIPIYDTLTAIIRRKVKKVSFFQPDKEHLHHKLLDYGLTTYQVLFIIYSVALIIVFTVLAFVLTLNILILDVLVVGWVLFSGLLYFITKKKRMRISKLISVLFSYR